LKATSLTHFAKDAVGSFPIPSDDEGECRRNFLAEANNFNVDDLMNFDDVGSGGGGTANGADELERFLSGQELI
jgi:hypothetical protein